MTKVKKYQNFLNSENVENVEISLCKNFYRAPMSSKIWQYA